jgi:hypothetical protein
LTLVDTKVLLDIVTNDPRWLSWSRLELARAFVAGPPVINDVVYAELSVRFGSIDTLDAALAELGMGWTQSLARRCFGGQSLQALPQSRRNTHRGITGFLHRRARIGS